MNIPEIVWLIAFVAFLAVEAGTICLVSIWFAAGALVALIVSWAGGQIWLQVVLFLVVSGALLGCLRPLIRKYVTPRVIRTNVDGIIGSVGVVTVAVDNLAAQGEVKLSGMEWAARSSDGSPIPAGTTVQVDRIEGVRVFVTPVPVGAEV